MKKIEEAKKTGVRALRRWDKAKMRCAKQRMLGRWDFRNNLAVGKVGVKKLPGRVESEGSRGKKDDCPHEGP